MSEILHVVLHMNPRGKQRPTVDCRDLAAIWKKARRTGVLPAFFTPRLVTPAPSQQWENQAAQLVRAQYDAIYGFDAPLIDRPVSLEVVAVNKRPHRLNRKRDPAGRIPWPSKADYDNIEKIVADSLVPVVERKTKKEVHPGILRDDAIICHGEITKWYGARGEAPSVEFWLREWPPVAPNRMACGCVEFLEACGGCRRVHSVLAD